MHRSGTSLLARLLEQWGIFVGAELDQNHESVFFQKINEWMFFQAHASWDSPDNMRLIDQPLRLLLERGVRHLLASAGRIQYLGKDKATEYRDITAIDFPWTWKDPRNIFTVDVWRLIFPTARLIHICRNPVDVANSIRSRERKRFIAIQKHIEASGLGQIVGQGQRFRTTVRCLDIREGIKLWKAYEDKASSALNDWAPPTLSIKYEALLDNPRDVAGQLADFAQLSPTDSLMRKTLSNIDASRRYAFLGSDELLSVYQDIRYDERVQKLGYGHIETNTT